MTNKIVFVVAVVAISFGCNFKKKTSTTGPEGRADGTVVLANEVQYPRVAVNNDTIFWTEGDLIGSKAIIHSMPADGEHVVSNLVTNIPAPIFVALDAGHLYWVGGEKLSRINLDGSSPITLAGTWPASPIALDAQNVFFDAPIDPVTTYSQGVASMPLAGGAMTLRHIFGERFAIDEKYLYVANESGSIKATPREGGNPVVIADVVPKSSHIAVDDVNLYYFDNGVMKMSKTDFIKTKLATPVGAITFLHVDGDFLYYVDTGSLGTGHSIMRVPIAGGEPVVMATKISEVSSIATDERSLYWGVLDRYKGAIMRVTPK